MLYQQMEDVDSGEIERRFIVVRETRTAAQFYKRFTFVLHLFTTKKLPDI